MQLLSGAVGAVPLTGLSNFRYQNLASPQCREAGDTKLDRRRLGAGAKPSEQAGHMNFALQRSRS